MDIACDIMESATTYSETAPEEDVERLAVKQQRDDNIILSPLWKGRLEKIAKSALALSELAPELAELAQVLEANSRNQAEQARSIAGVTEEVTASLTSAVDRLQESYGAAASMIGAIGQIASDTKVLALNAKIAAARAGDAGRAFGTVADNVKTLANQTSKATDQTAVNLGAISTNINDVAIVAGSARHEESATPGAPAAKSRDDLFPSADAVTEEETATANVAEVRSGISAVATQAAQQMDKVHVLRATSEKVRELTEELLLAFGVFRLTPHEKARAVCESMIQNHQLRADSGKARKEATLREYLARYPFIQLLYITDASGTQVTDNISDHPEIRATAASACGADWSARNWFTSAIRSQDVFISDIYRSVASGQFCFTVSSRILNEQNEIAGVLAADIDFREMLNLL